MWPILLDMSKVDCKRMLRRLELEAYGNLVSAFRAQGGLSSEKHKLLQEISLTLNIPQERHRAEIRRAVNDERLATVAYCMTGDDTTDEWALEGRRLVPLMPRLVPQTAYSVIADEEANKASIDNEKLPTPASTERKRNPQTNILEANKNIQYATSEFQPKHPNQSILEDGNIKKRKANLSMESSTLAQHLIMGPPKISRVQQLYRQKTKAILKHSIKPRAPSTQHITGLHKTNRKIDDVIKNISHAQIPLQKIPIENKNTNIPIMVSNPGIVTVSNENLIPQNKISSVQTTTKPAISSANTIKVQQPLIVNATEVAPKSIKICPARKVITATSRAQNQSQKLIIVSNSQGSTTSSILQRTLTIPFVKTISMKNLDKLKVINNTVQSSASCNVSTTISNQKPKLLTVHTKMKSNTPGKHINIPFIQGVQLQALQNKGAIKMVPLSTTTKMTSKPAIINTTSGSVYIMNSNANISAVTASNSSPIMTAKPQTSSEKTQENHRNVYIIKNEEIKPAVSLINNTENVNNQNLVLLNVQSQKMEQKSSVLTEILKASGVIPTDESDIVVHDPCDIESQISQLTEIPNSGENEETVINSIPDICETVESTDFEMMEEIQESHEVEQYENIVGDISPNSVSNVEHSDYVILQEDSEESEMLVSEMEDESQKQDSEVLEMMGSLDPETGMYSLQAPEVEGIIDSEHNPSSSYIIEMENVNSSQLDMPALSLN